MVDSHAGQTVAGSPPEQAPRRWRTAVPILQLLFILLVAAGLRLWGIGSTSLYYDEVISMRVARAPGPVALLPLLEQLDGTRAPLHPLVLQLWLRIFGSSDLAGRSLSAVCGILTVVVVYRLARASFNDRTARWAAWLSAVCPPLVYYSREARMYAWLVLLTSLSWLILLSFRRRAEPALYVAYWLLLASLAYSHPLGLFMIAAHGFAYLLVRSSLKLSLRWWLAIQLAVILAIAPWLSRYMDHGTDYPMPRYSVRYLLAVPIEYVGGNAIVLGVCLAIIVLGIVSWKQNGFRRRLEIVDPVENTILLAWCALPPLTMYLYSYFFQPIFGPPRYHLFVAPAYLILLAHGLGKLHAMIRWPAAMAALALSLTLLRSDVYSQSVRADWRSLSEWLDSQSAAHKPDGSATPCIVVVHPSDPRFPRDEIEAARYYLSPRYLVLSDRETSAPRTGEPATTYDAYCLADTRHALADSVTQQFHGIVLTRRVDPESLESK